MRSGFFRVLRIKFLFVIQVCLISSSSESWDIIIMPMDQSLSKAFAKVNTQDALLRSFDKNAII